MTVLIGICGAGGFTDPGGSAYVGSISRGGERGRYYVEVSIKTPQETLSRALPASFGDKLSVIPPATALAVVVAGFATFLNMWCTQAILPVLAKSLHVSEVATGATVTAPLIATAMLAPVVGMLSDRFGRRIFIRTAALLLAIPAVTAAFSVNLDMLIICRFMQGLLLPFIFTITIAYISDEMTPAAAMRMVGIYSSGAISGGFAGRLVSGVVTSALNWHAGFLAVGLLTLASALVITFCLPKERCFKPVYGIAGALRSFPNHLSNVPLLATYAVGFGLLFSLVCAFTFINFRLAVPPYNLGPGALGSLFVVYLGGIVVAPIMGRLMATVDRRWLMVGCVGLVVVGVLLTLARPLYLICLGLLLLCLGVFPQQTLTTGIIGVVARGAKSAAVGLYVTFYYVGGSFGGIVPAVVWRDAGWPGCVAITVAVQLIMLALVWFSWRPERPSGARTQSV